jgi:tripartite-type tricarboxylate transporter receptor subunit TctC
MTWKDMTWNMRMQPLRILAAGALALLGLALAVPDRSAWPQAARTIRIVISVPPGGSIDFLVRLLADQIGKSNGQTIIIESRPGAGGVIAAETVARAAPDGNTLLVNTNGMLINSILRKVNFDPRASFEPICHLVSSPQVIVVNAGSPHRTLADFVGAARDKPAELSLASVGPNTTQHIAIERLKRLAEVNVTYVPYTGGAPAINALLGGHVSAVLQNYSEVGEQLTAGKLRALATMSPRRLAPLPEVPTVAEAGYRDLETDVWFGLVAPAKTPKEAVSQLIEWFSTALLAPEVGSKLMLRALYPDPRCGADFAAHIQRQSDEYARVIRELNIKG